MCLIVCHENGISVDGWRDSGGEMQSKGKQQKRMDCYRYRLPLSVMGEHWDGFTFCVCVCVCVCCKSIYLSIYPSIYLSVDY